MVFPKRGHVWRTQPSPNDEGPPTLLETRESLAALDPTKHVQRDACRSINTSIHPSQWRDSMISRHQTAFKATSKQITTHPVSPWSVLVKVFPASSTVPNSAKSKTVSTLEKDRKVMQPLNFDRTIFHHRQTCRGLCSEMARVQDWSRKNGLWFHNKKLASRKCI